MWKQIFDMAKWLLLLAEDTKRNQDEIKEVGNLAAAVERLAYEIDRVSEKDDHEREKIMLQLENALLRLEQRLLLGTKSEEPEDKG